MHTEKNHSFKIFKTLVSHKHSPAAKKPPLEKSARKPRTRCSYASTLHLVFINERLQFYLPTTQRVVIINKIYYNNFVCIAGKTVLCGTYLPSFAWHCGHSVRWYTNYVLEFSQISFYHICPTGASKFYHIQR